MSEWHTITIQRDPVAKNTYDSDLMAGLLKDVASAVIDKGINFDRRYINLEVLFAQKTFKRRDVLGMASVLAKALVKSGAIERAEQIWSVNISKAIEPQNPRIVLKMKELNA